MSDQRKHDEHADDEAVESRSADPGQSSYGGFKNEGPSVQNDHDAEDDAKAPKKP